MCAEKTQQVDVQFVDVDSHTPDRLRRVGMQHHVVAAAERGDFFQRLERSDFVVGHHERNHACLLVQRSSQLIQIDRARRFVQVIADRQQHDFEALLLETLEWIENRPVLGRAADDLAPRLPRMSCVAKENCR